MLYTYRNKKIAKVIIEQKGERFNCIMCECNALFCIEYHYKKDGVNYVQLVSFASDLQHFKNCAKDNLYNFEKIVFNRNNGNAKQLAQLFIKYTNTKTIIY